MAVAVPVKCPNQKMWTCESSACVLPVQVLATELNDRGFLFLLSSVQMAPPPGERAHFELQWSFSQCSFAHLSS